ncbi:MAG TPA: BMC domain-containing protein [Planctomycetota bacterium]|nr:BMC domain-containing protein [Planctomycetota bacterium]
MNRNDLNPELRDSVAMRACIGLLELSSVARGIEVADTVLWEARVELLFATPVHPGKYVILFTGSVEDVRISLRHGAEVAASDLVDQLIIQQVHEQVVPMLKRNGGHVSGELDAIGVIETNTVASAIFAADVALKTATVDLLELRIANGLGGKSFFTLTGEVSDVRSAVAAGARTAQDRGLLAREVVIARPHPELAFHL